MPSSAPVPVETKYTPPTDAECKAAFEKFDKDKSGSIDKEEFEELWFALIGADGILDSEEMKALNESMDTSKDGLISLDEFTAWAKDFTPTKKPFVQANTLRAKLFTRMAGKFLKGSTAVEQDGKSKLSLTVGEVKVAKTTITWTLTKLPAPATPVAGPPQIKLEFDIGHNGGAAFKPFVDGLVSHLLSCLAIAPPGPGTPKIQLSHPDADTFRFTVTSACPPDLFMFADMVEQKVGSVSAKLELAYDIAELAAKTDTLKMNEFLNFRLSFDGQLPAEVQAQLGMVIPAIESQGFSADDIPGLKDLVAGKKNVAVDASAFVLEALKKAGPMGNMLLIDAPGMPPSHAAFQPIKAVALAFFTLGRDIAAPRRFSGEKPGYKGEIALDTKSTVSDIAAFFDAVQASLEKKWEAEKA